MGYKNVTAYLERSNWSMKSNIEELPHNYQQVVSVLGYGKYKAITNQRIRQITGIQDSRSIYQIIEDLINNYGYVIGASRQGKFKGYYLIENEQELKESLFSFNNQIASMQKRLASLQLNFSEYSEN